MKIKYKNIIFINFFFKINIVNFFFSIHNYCIIKKHFSEKLKEKRRSDKKNHLLTCIIMES